MEDEPKLHTDPDTVSAQEDNDFYKEMLDMIPVKFYFSKTANSILGKENNESEKDSRPQKSKKRKGEEPKERQKMKHFCLDPSVPQTVTQIQHTLIQAEKNQQTTEKKKKVSTDKEKEVDDDVDSILSSTGSSEGLRAKLKAKIEAMEVKRGAMGKADFWEKKRMKRRESKMKQKLKRKINKQNAAKGQDSPKGTVNGKVDTPKKQVYNSEGKMVFSKFDFSESDKGKKHSDLPTGKDYKRLLEKVTKQKEKLAKLKETDETKANELVEKTAWRTALAKAEGVKVKDNPELLKKALKRKEQTKRKSAKVWEEKTTFLEKSMKMKQDKRNKHLQNRKKANLKRKMDKLKKKGRVIPGF